MKTLAAEVYQPTAEVIRQATQNLPAGVQARLPTVSNLKRTVQRLRYANDYPALPRTLAELELPDDLCQLNDANGNEMFLKHDSGQADGEDRYYFILHY